jgi:antibiotic biosynthesis monooxygenase (ABM) superfamily enzyme
MSVTVLVTRRVSTDKKEEAIAIVREIRSMATLRQGHIFGETLYSQDNPGKVVVVSHWAERSQWEAWRVDPERQALTDRMAGCLEEPEDVEVFQVGEKLPAWVHMA